MEAQAEREGKGATHVNSAYGLNYFVQKRRRPTLGVQLDDKRKEMLKRHPLSVMVDLKCKGLVALASLWVIEQHLVWPALVQRVPASQSPLCP